LDEKEKNEINTERSKQFKQACKKANATPFNCRWSWKNIGGDIGQIMIRDENGDGVALWEEYREQLQMLIDEWDFRENQFMAIGIIHQHRIISVRDGVYALAWIDREGLFQSIYFEQNNISLSTDSNILDELKELDELDGYEIVDDDY